MGPQLPLGWKEKNNKGRLRTLFLTTFLPNNKWNGIINNNSGME